MLCDYGSAHRSRHELERRENATVRRAPARELTINLQTLDPPEDAQADDR
jgi:hypothetical protein